MPYTPIAENPQDEKHRNRQVGELQRSPVAENRYLGAEWDERERGERGNRRDDRGRHVYEPVDAAGGDALLERQLDPVGQALQEAPRTRPVGAGPPLHPAQDLALGQDCDQHVQHQEHEDGQRFT